MIKVVSLVFAFLFSFSFASAGYKGGVSFSSSEKATHKSKIRTFNSVAASCLQSYKSEHLSFYNNECSKGKCLSKFYGDRRYSKSKGAKRSDGKALTYLPSALVAAGFPASYSKKMRSTSCVGMALDCLGRAFKATGQSKQWARIKSFTRKNGVGGTALQHGLRAIGWKVYYWNPNPSQMSSWDAQEKNWKSKGWHKSRYNSVKKKGTYWFNRIDNSTAMVGFGKGSPRILADTPFWVGTAHTGYHVFPGTYSKVVEAHSTRHLTAKDNLEFSTFAPFASGGGPRWTATEKYRSGMIAIPPR